LQAKAKVDASRIVFFTTGWGAPVMKKVVAALVATSATRTGAMNIAYSQEMVLSIP
jgi:hypothetical protein